MRFHNQCRSWVLFISFKLIWKWIKYISHFAEKDDLLLFVLSSYGPPRYYLHGKNKGKFLLARMKNENYYWHEWRTAWRCCIQNFRKLSEEKYICLKLENRYYNSSYSTSPTKHFVWSNISIFNINFCRFFAMGDNTEPKALVTVTNNI